MKHLPWLSLGKEEGKTACFGTGIKPTFTHQRYLQRACCSRFPPSITAQILLFCCYFFCSRCGHDSEPFLECWQALTVSLLAQHSCAVSLETWHRNALRGAAGRRQGMETVSSGFFPLLVLYPSKAISNMQATYSKQECQGGNRLTVVPWAETGHEWPNLCSLVPCFSWQGFFSFW